MFLDSDDRPQESMSYYRAKSDIELRGNSTAGGTTITGTMSILVIKESELNGLLGLFGGQLVSSSIDATA